MPPPKPTAWLFATVVLSMFTKGVGFVAPASIWFVMRMLMPPPCAPTPPVPSVWLFENVEPVIVTLTLSPNMLRPPPHCLLRVVCELRVRDRHGARGGGELVDVHAAAVTVHVCVLRDDAVRDRKAAANFSHAAKVQTAAGETEERVRRWLRVAAEPNRYTRDVKVLCNVTKWIEREHLIDAVRRIRATLDNCVARSVTRDRQAPGRDYVQVASHVEVFVHPAGVNDRKRERYSVRARVERDRVSGRRIVVL